MRNPGCSPRTSYAPAGRAGALNKPSALAIADRTNSVALLVIVILANGMTAPDSSVTVPVMIPVGTCASAAKHDIAHISNIDLDVSDMLDPQNGLSNLHGRQSLGSSRIPNNHSARPAPLRPARPSDRPFGGTYSRVPGRCQWKFRALKAARIRSPGVLIAGFRRLELTWPHPA